MFVKDMKLLIRYAIELDISELECKLGYKGDAILRLSSSDRNIIKKIEAFCDNMDIEHNTLYNNRKISEDIFCIFNTDIYKLK